MGDMYVVLAVVQKGGFWDISGVNSCLNASSREIVFSTNSIAAGCCVQAKGGSTVSGDDVLPDLSAVGEDFP